jgi:hypothetical protein
MKVREQIMQYAISQPLGEEERSYNDALISAADIAEAAEREHEKFRDTVFQVLKDFGSDDDEWCTASLILKQIHKRSAGEGVR